MDADLDSLLTVGRTDASDRAVPNSPNVSRLASAFRRLVPRVGVRSSPHATALISGCIGWTGGRTIGLAMPGGVSHRQSGTVHLAGGDLS